MAALRTPSTHIRVRISAVGLTMPNMARNFTLAVARRTTTATTIGDLRSRLTELTGDHRATAGLHFQGFPVEGNDMTPLESFVDPIARVIVHSDIAGVDQPLLFFPADNGNLTLVVNPKSDPRAVLAGEGSVQAKVDFHRFRLSTAIDHATRTRRRRHGTDCFASWGTAEPKVDQDEPSLKEVPCETVAPPLEVHRFPQTDSLKAPSSKTLSSKTTTSGPPAPAAAAAAACRGPHLAVVGGVHGNETTGMKGAELVSSYLRAAALAAVDAATETSLASASDSKTEDLVAAQDKHNGGDLNSSSSGGERAAATIPTLPTPAPPIRLARAILGRASVTVVPCANVLGSMAQARCCPTAGTMVLVDESKSVDDDDDDESVGDKFVGDHNEEEKGSMQEMHGLSQLTEKKATCKRPKKKLVIGAHQHGSHFPPRGWHDPNRLWRHNDSLVKHALSQTLFQGAVDDHRRQDQEGEEREGEGDNQGGSEDGSEGGGETTTALETTGTANMVVWNHDWAVPQGKLYCSLPDGPAAAPLEKPTQQHHHQQQQQQQQQQPPPLAEGCRHIISKYYPSRTGFGLPYEHVETINKPLLSNHDDGDADEDNDAADEDNDGDDKARGCKKEPLMMPNCVNQRFGTTCYTLETYCGERSVVPGSLGGEYLHLEATLYLLAKHAGVVVVGTTGGGCGGDGGGVRGDGGACSAGGGGGRGGGGGGLTFSEAELLEEVALIANTMCLKKEQECKEQMRC